MYRCEFCKEPIKPGQTGTFRYVEGWMQFRSGGGGNAVALPKLHDRFAHRTCIDSAKRGTQGQESLL